eukprot:10744853-Karenia_brevis.AAC.1
MSPIWSGVNQGCPASAVLFVMAIDPTLRLLKAHVEDRSKGVFRACADDVAGMISDLGHLPLVADIFGLTGRATALELNVSKCVIVPLWGT